MYILISYFDPFNKAEINFSQRVAEELKHHFLSKSDAPSVELVCLPTIYDRGAQVLLDRYHELSAQKGEDPLFILSLGEGGDDIRFEQLFHNEDHNPNIADNAGEHRHYQPILKDEPLVLFDRLSLKKIWSELNLQGQSIACRLSLSAGSFVCNNTAYGFAHACPHLPYGFIHVPSHRYLADLKDNDIFEQMKRIVEKLITQWKKA